MTETLTQTKVSSSDLESLEAALRESKRLERELARNLDELPERIRAATQAHARRLSDASRKGKDALARADKESEVFSLREREKDLPFLRWSQSIRTAAIEMEYNSALQAEGEDQAHRIQPNLLPAKEEMDAATARFNSLRNELVQAQRSVDVYSGYKAAAQKRLTTLEANYPGA